MLEKFVRCQPYAASTYDVAASQRAMKHMIRNGDGRVCGSQQGNDTPRSGGEANPFDNRFRRVASAELVLVARLRCLGDESLLESGLNRELAQPG